jgi:hypothetical protein
MAEGIFYVVELALPAEHLEEFAAWYPAVHAPHLFQAGFSTCASYLAVSGGLSLVDIYEAAAWEVFEAPAFARYRAIAAADTYRPKVLAQVTNPRTVYHHHAGSPLPSRDAAMPLDSDWVLIWRLAGDEATEARAAAWLEAEGSAALGQLGARRLRLLHRGRDTPTGTSFRPRLALLTEWPVRPPEAAALAALSPALRDAVGAEESFAGLRLYPWPAAPAARDEMMRRVSGLAG